MKPEISILLTLGDPGGIGSEVALKAICRRDVREMCHPVIVGDINLARATAKAYGLPLAFEQIDTPNERLASGRTGVIDSPARPKGGAFVTGLVDAANAVAARAWIEEAVRLALCGQADAIVTAPISKEAMYAAGYDFPGHTELLAALCGGCAVRMMLAGGGLHVVLETIHAALSEVPRLLTGASLKETIRISCDWASWALGSAPRIAVCGLNPHAGEGGHFGREELDVIAPAISEARVAGANVSGPHPADTVFHRARSGDFDMIVAMYHDQALIPVKTLDFHGGVNVTLGLPIIRTSPDHGTAFDRAGRGAANESSMAAAVRMAAHLAMKKKDRFQ
ncbi:MAG: 4-hydroxythreonine-4-phosphate dehydrogenase PdxA [bacterium]|nr:4-hydroxythreonine-4-phosphate dehydrogenase PdxA [Candidatus Sumerlaeota bacterium]